MLGPCNNRGEYIPNFHRETPAQALGVRRRAGWLQTERWLSPVDVVAWWLNKVLYNSTAGGAWCPCRAAVAIGRRYPSRKVMTFFWVVDFFEFLFLLKNLGVVEERESRASALSLSLLHDDTAIRCEEQLIKH